MRRGAGLVYLGLGSNLGDRAGALAAAVAALRRAGIEPRRTSPVYESTYVGPGAPQPAYLNAVVEADTALLPLALLDATQAIERAAGRAPGTHLQPRPLDIDLLLYGDWIVRHTRLVVPHPRLAMRRFVLQPLADLGVLERWPELARALQALGREQPLGAVPQLDLGTGVVRASAVA